MCINGAVTGNAEVGSARLDGKVSPDRITHSMSMELDAGSTEMN